MDRRALFKSTASSSKYTRENRTKQNNEKRQKDRHDLYLTQRDITEEPTAVPETDENPVLSDRQLRYKKLIAWRTEKNKKLKKSTANPKPFVSTVATGRIVDKDSNLLRPMPQNYTFKPSFDFTKLPKIKTPKKNNLKSQNPPKKTAPTATVTVPLPKVKKQILLKPPLVAKDKKQVLVRPTQTRNQIVQKPVKPSAKLVKPTVIPKKTKKKPSPNLEETMSDTGPISFGSNGGLITSTTQKVKRSATPENSMFDLLSPIEFYTEPKKPKEPANDEANTSLNSSGTNYLSSFVTTTRGKVSAKKELRNRNSVYKLELNQSIDDPLETRQNKEAAAYFQTQLDNETARLMGLVDEWTAYKLEHASHMESEYVDLIDVTIGQTTLLTSKKFKQFQTLINQCEEGTKTVQKVLPKDLEGFWFMVYMQVENCDVRFEKLNKLKSNNWIDVELLEATAAAAAAKKKKVPKKPIVVVERKASIDSKRVISNHLQNILKAAKAYNLKKRETTVAKPFTVDFGNLNISTPKKATSTPRKTPRKSLLATVLNHEASKMITPTKQKQESKNTLTPNSKRKSSAVKKDTSAVTKSILKTPGNKSKNRRVIFCENDIQSQHSFEEILSINNSPQTPHNDNLTTPKRRTRKSLNMLFSPVADNSDTNKENTLEMDGVKIIDNKGCTPKIVRRMGTQKSKQSNSSCDLSFKNSSVIVIDSSPDSFATNINENSATRRQSQLADQSLNSSRRRSQRHLLK